MNVGETRQLSFSETAGHFTQCNGIIKQGQLPNWLGKPVAEQEYIANGATEQSAINSCVKRVKYQARSKLVRAWFVRQPSVTALDDGTFMCAIPAAFVRDQKPMDFSAALIALKKGKYLRRSGWNAAGQFVYKETLKYDGIELAPCFVLYNAQGIRQPGWIPSMGDLLARDWLIVDTEATR